MESTSRRFFVTAGAASLLTLCGCGGGTQATYDLSSLQGVAGGGGRAQLVVSAPVATAALDSERIVIRPQPDQVAHLSGAQWADRLPLLAQARIVQSLENARMLAAVARTGMGVTGDYAMSGEIRRFEIDVAAGQAVVEITMKLLRNADGRVVGATIARGVASGSAESAEAATQALDQAFQQALAQIVGFVRTKI
jgi:cholesterol transport system auxiliary component